MSNSDKKTRGVWQVFSINNSNSMQLILHRIVIELELFLQMYVNLLFHPYFLAINQPIP